MQCDFYFFLGAAGAEADPCQTISDLHGASSKVFSASSNLFVGKNVFFR